MSEKPKHPSLEPSQASPLEQPVTPQLQEVDLKEQLAKLKESRQEKQKLIAEVKEALATMEVEDQELADLMKRLLTHILRKVERL